MKKIILSAMLAAAFTQTRAQAITDTVSIGASYVNQVWYSLANDQQGAAVANNWDLGFNTGAMSADIMINSATGATLWKYPSSDTAGWATLDTAGLSTWPMHWNSDTSWLGAMGNYANPSNPFDLDWGLYNITTHIVTGDSLYVIKLASGQYKKLWIVSLNGTVYTFRYANLDGSSDQTATLDKTSYTGKNFGYYSLQTNAALDREPLSSNWDLLFTQYTAFVPIPYTVTGVLSNNGVQVAKCSAIPDVNTYTNYAAATFNTAINTIGYDWKTYSGTYTVQDSLLYFVQPVDGSIWKVIFTGFGGSANGDYIFSKEKLLAATGVPNINGTPTASLSVYPNPSNGQAVNVIYSFTDNTNSATLSVVDIAGRTVLTDNLDHSSGLHQYNMPVNKMQPGMYLVNIETANGRVQQKLIIQ